MEVSVRAMSICDPSFCDVSLNGGISQPLSAAFWPAEHADSAAEPISERNPFNLALEVNQ